MRNCEGNFRSEGQKKRKSGEFWDASSESVLQKLLCLLIPFPAAGNSLRQIRIDMSAPGTDKDRSIFYFQHLIGFFCQMPAVCDNDHAFAEFVGGLF